MSRFSGDLLVRALAAVGRAPAPAFQATQPAPGTMHELAIATTLALCKRFEGFISAPYLCPASVPTIGYGATYYEDGRAVTLKDPPISKERALALLAWMVKTVYLPAVLKLCPGITDPRRLAAIIDWCFNLGEGNLRASTLRRRINAGMWNLVPAEILRWDRAGGVRMRGLTLRRQAEAALI